MIYKGLITLLMLSSIACNGQSGEIQKEAAAAKARQDKTKPNPAWLKKKIVPLTTKEAADLKSSEQTLEDLSKQEDAAEEHESELRQAIVDAHGFSKYPALLDGQGGYNSAASACNGTLSIIAGDNDQSYVMYTPGGMGCYIGTTSGWITGSSGGVILANPDVEDKR